MTIPLLPTVIYNLQIPAILTQWPNTTADPLQGGELILGLEGSESLNSSCI